MHYPRPVFQRQVVLFVLFISLSFPSFANKFFEDKDAFFIKYLKQENFDFDVNSAAIVIYEKSSTELNNNNGVFYIRQQIRRIIKILNKNGLSYADVSITENGGSEISRVKGVTYNLVQNSLDRQILEKSSIYTTKSDYLVSAKFGLPSVREGSIIDYSYTVERPLSLLILDWEFQAKIPKLFSDVEVFTPYDLNLRPVILGTLAFHEIGNAKKEIDEISLPDACEFVEQGTGIDFSKRRWIRKNIPVIKDEPFTTIENYSEKLKLLITGVQEPRYAVSIMDTWEKLNHYLLNSFHFYKPIEQVHSSVFEKANLLIKGISDPVEKARILYHFVQKEFSCKGDSRIWIWQDMDKIFENRSGSASELNLLFITMLGYAKLSCSPVIIATSDETKADGAFPYLEQFDRTICELTIGSKKYLLDASVDHCPFGILPNECYNGYAWVIGKNGGHSLYLNSQEAKDKIIYLLNVSWVGDTVMEIQGSEKIGMVSGINLRDELAKDEKNVRTYILDNFENLAADVKIDDVKIDQLDEPDTSLMLNYSLTLNLKQPANIFYLNPNFIKFFAENPFKSMKRYLPIEFPGNEERMYIMRMQMPIGYAPELSGNPVLIKYRENEMSFKYTAQYDSTLRVLSVNKNFTLSKTQYSSSDYKDIQTFFDKMMQEENNIITFKKE